MRLASGGGGAVQLTAAALEFVATASDGLSEVEKEVLPIDEAFVVHMTMGCPK